MSRGRPKKLNIVQSEERVSFDHTSIYFQSTIELLSPRARAEILNAQSFEELSSGLQAKFLRAERRFRFSQRHPVRNFSRAGSQTSTPRIRGGVKKRLVRQPYIPTTPNIIEKLSDEEESEEELSYDLSPTTLTLTPQKRPDSITAYADNVIQLINNSGYVGEAATGCLFCLKVREERAFCRLTLTPLTRF